MSDTPIKEGEVPFDAPNGGKSGSTWYKIHGSLEASSATPIVVLHGGPGGGHEYMSPFTKLYSDHGMPLVFYDQVGCGKSTHYQDKQGDEAFWSFDLFIKELDNLIDHLGIRKTGFHVLGHSWGGMLGAVYAARNPGGLKKLVIASAPASVPLYMVGNEQLRAQLPPDIRKALEKEDMETKEYKEALDYFYKQFVCRIDPMPKDVQAVFEHIEEDPTSYLTIQGPSEVVIVGSIKDWDGSDLVKDIRADTLITNGKYDEMTDICVEPWFKNIPRAKWVTFENSSHMSHWEEPDRFFYICGSFLAS